MIFQQLFESGISFESFVNNDSDGNTEKLLQIYEGIQIDSELIEQIESINKEINILAFAETWCPDSIINLPAIKKINDINPKIKFKIIHKEGNEAYLDNYKISGKHRTPTFIVFNDVFDEIGAFIEYPKTFRDIVNKGNQVELVVAKRKYHKGEYVTSTIKDIIKLIKNN